jgi:hypothetical protein
MMQTLDLIRQEVSLNQLKMRSPSSHMAIYGLLRELYQSRQWGTIADAKYQVVQRFPGEVVARMPNRMLKLAQFHQTVACQTLLKVLPISETCFTVWASMIERLSRCRARMLLADVIQIEVDLRDLGHLHRRDSTMRISPS